MPKLAKQTWPEAADALGPDVVVIVPIGSTEPHGPHLPLDTDVTIALAQSRRAAERLEAEGVRALLVPPIAYGVTRWTDGFAGTIGLRPGTLWALLEDVITGLEDHGVRRIVLSNGHLEPAHIEVLRGVPLDHQAQDGETSKVIFADNTRRRWAKTLGDEFASGECHAGRYESSIVLAADPDSVRDETRKALAPVEIGLLERIQEGARNFRECGADQAYCGDPAGASAAEGRDLIDRLATVLVTSVRETWPELFA
jgi:creatinine amidohydrolase